MTDRRTILAALGLVLPFAIPSRCRAFPSSTLRYCSFKDALTEAFHTREAGTNYCRVEVGHCSLIQAGVQGCVNDRPFAGFAESRLRIVRSASGPGPSIGGVRLYVTTLDVTFATGDGESGRPLNFAALPPAPYLVGDETTYEDRGIGPEREPCNIPPSRRDSTRISGDNPVNDIQRRGKLS